MINWQQDLIDMPNISEQAFDIIHFKIDMPNPLTNYRDFSSQIFIGIEWKNKRKSHV